MYIYYTNLGNIPMDNAELSITLPSELQFLSLSVGYIRTGTYSGYTVTDHLLTIPLGTVDPSERYGGYFFLTGLLSDTATIGDTLEIGDSTCYSYDPDGPGGQDAVEDCSKGSTGRPITGSIDPNDKLAYPGGKDIVGRIAPNERIEYLIQFENKREATAEATYIMVIDTLDPNLDWGSLAFGSVSHPAALKTMDFDPFTGVITWFFEDIMLPPNQSPPEGEGFISYTVSPKKDLPEGTAIPNSAYIKFDYNAWLRAPEAGPIVRTIEYPYLCGDGNDDAVVDIADAVYLINYIFRGGPAPNPLASGDGNCDSVVDIADAVYLISYIFRGGPQPYAGCK